MLNFFAYGPPGNKLFDALAAKSGQGQQEGWLPIWVHLLDTAGIMELLQCHWCADTAGAMAQLTNPEVAQACIFLALVHDIGKCTPIFQAKITAQNPELKACLENRSIEISASQDFLDPNRTPHGMAGEAILLHLGCPPGIAAVVGTHHGRPQEIGEDAEDWLICYEQNFYGLGGERSQNGERWETLWQEWLDFSLCACGYPSIEALPELDVPTQMLAAGILIMADWIASKRMKVISGAVVILVAIQISALGYFEIGPLGFIYNIRMSNLPGNKPESEIKWSHTCIKQPCCSGFRPYAPAVRYIPVPIFLCWYTSRS